MPIIYHHHWWSPCMHMHEYIVLLLASHMYTEYGGALGRLPWRFGRDRLRKQDQWKLKKWRA